MTDSSSEPPMDIGMAADLMSLPWKTAMSLNKKPKDQNLNIQKQTLKILK